MSLVFAALKKLETPADAAAATLAHAPAAMPSSRRWLLPACTAAAGVLAGVGLFAVLRPADVAPATPASAAVVAPATVVDEVKADTVASAPTHAPAITAPTAVAITPAVTVDPTAAVVAAPPATPTIIETVPTQADHVAPAALTTPAPATTAATVATTASATPATAPAAAAAAPIAPPQRAPRALPTAAEIHVADKPETDTAEGRDVARLVAAIGNALQAGDTAQAQAQLIPLARQLPPRSLTLLRMQAWVAHESGDTAAALAYYRQIVERVPGDQATVINLAMLEARSGQIDSARDRLRRLRTLEPGSNEIEKAIAMVEARLQ